MLAGGDTRLQTIAKRLAATHEPWIVVHDAARPFADAETIVRTLAAGRAHGGAIACRRASVPVGRITQGCVTSVLPADDIALLESPVVLRREWLLQMLEYAHARQLRDASLSQLAQACGLSLHAVFGNDDNRKITSAADWAWALHCHGDEDRGPG